ncbi:transglycosylase domain-containing protein [Mangrovicoccus algicola]|uniref:peptidoglycan glycosyltransferase n=1 Tax=Mangrovicoccus algicola TaxID=2771008 RepID=A0A8J6ZAR4_9RHOB|nr:PBP1A family penicillin-binding protein [Mangrovicoccus algicola]MBE3639311.1 PBP1A family penicillin-binding protein [Mangrovicoccus algicola]
MSRPTTPRRPVRATGGRPAPKAAKRPSAKDKAAPRTRKKAAPARRRGGGNGGGGRRAPWPVRLVRGLLRAIWGAGWRLAVFAGLILAGWVGVVYSTLPPVSQLMDGRVRGSVTLLDRNGETFAWRGDQYGGGVHADTVSPDLKNAIVATEDRRFYRHPGVDPIGIIGAMRINMAEGRSPLSGNGGSTITQQTAKLLCVGRDYDPSSGQSEAQYEAGCRESTLARKAREAIYAMAMEVKYSKDEILTIYMNRAYLGAGTRGFEAASQLYFGKPASEVGPAEAAMLAGLLKAPSRYAPTANLARSQERATVIVGLMRDQGYLSAEEAELARAHPATISAAAANRTGGYFADWVMSVVPEYYGRGTTEDVTIRTTLDMDMQLKAEAALAEVFRTKVREGSTAEAAIVVMGADGAVRAMVGGRDADVPGGFNRAVQAKRQTGSAFKPFVYATALDLGHSYNDMVEDAPLTINVPGSGPWTPQNYTRTYHGWVSLTDALKDSLNIPAVKVSEAVGRDNVIRVATDFGIDSTMFDGPSLALGVSEASLLELTGAYAGILNGGQSVAPYGLTTLSVRGESAPVMEKEGGIGERVISRDAAMQLVYMMNQVIEGGTGQRARLDGRPAAGKTGTTSSARDAWFMGFTGDFVAGVWMGYDDNTPLTGVTGGGLPAEIWHEAMSRINAGRPVTPLPMITPSERQPERMVGGGSPAPGGARPAQPQVPDLSDLPEQAQGLAEKILKDVRGLFGRN